MVTVTKYVWDPVFDCVSHELDENNDVKAVYHNEPQQYGGVLSQRRGSTSHYHHHDALGSTRFLTDSSGNVTDTYLNDAWGNSVATFGTTVNPFKWVGKYGYYTDASTGQVYVRARMYQPTAARWCSVDPIKFVDGPNLYRAALNNIVNIIDPTGTVGVVPTTPRKLDPTCENLDAYASWSFSIAEWPCRSGHGFFIQKVTMSCMICDCQQNRQAGCGFDTLQYWEVWPVAGPNIPPNNAFPYTAPVLDTAEWTGFDAKDKRGFYRQYGTIKFYCVAPSGSKPRDGEVDFDYLLEIFTQHGDVNPGSICPTSTTSLLFTKGEPNFWTQGGDGGDIGKRLFRLSWNCCCGVNQANASARP
jgi:RHS repeat-associated protein